jgi:hypothetical protein
MSRAILACRATALAMALVKNEQRWNQDSIETRSVMSAGATHPLLAPAFGRIAVAGHGTITDAVAGGFERAAHRLLPIPVGAAGQEQQQCEGQDKFHDALL